MKQEKLIEIKKGAIEKPLKFTQSVLTKTQEATDKSYQFTQSVIEQSKKCVHHQRK